MSQRALEERQARKLQELLRTLLASNAFYALKLAARGVGAPAVEGARDLAALLELLPVTTKAELVEDQAAHPPFGTNLSEPIEAYVRAHRTSGTSTGAPLWWLDTPASWQGCLASWREVLEAAGLRRGERILFPFSFGPFLGFWAGFEAAVDLGALVIPAGGLGTGPRLELLREVGATFVAATPTYALRLAEAAREAGMDLAASSVHTVIVAGEPGGSVPAVRERIERAWGARCFDHCGMTELGPVGFECREAPLGIHVREEAYIPEVLDPTGRIQRCARDGDELEGELVLTGLGRSASPLVRYRTGDWVRLRRAPCPCGRPFARLEGGILGRVDDMVIIRGNNVYPSALEAAVLEEPEVAECRIRCRGDGAVSSVEVEVEVEVQPADPSMRGRAPPPADARGAFAPSAEARAVRDRVASRIEKRFLFKASVRIVPPGALPRFELKGKRFIKEISREN